VRQIKKLQKSGGKGILYNIFISNSEEKRRRRSADINYTNIKMSAQQRNLYLGTTRAFNKALV